MKQNDKWEEQLRQQMAGQEAHVPDDLWASIELALPESKPKTRVIPLWTRWTAAAAAAVAALALIITNIETQEEMQQKEETQTISQPIAQATTTKITTTTKTTKTTAKAKNTTVVEAAEVPTSEEITEDHQEPQEKQEPQPQTSSPEPPHSSLSASIASNTSSTSSTASRSNVSHLSFSLMAQNTFGSNSQTEDVLMAPSLIDHINGGAAAARKRGEYYLANAEVTREHSVPIALGLGMSYALGERWRLHTGIDYLHTTTTLKQRVGATTIVSRNQLSYLGIPLRASLQFFKLKSLHVYGITGGEMMINVKNQRTTNGVVASDDRDHLQFAIDAALGMELRFLGHAAVYAEPGLKYYFDNGSSVDTYFKVHQLAPSLHFGLRYDF